MAALSKRIIIINLIGKAKNILKDPDKYGYQEIEDAVRPILDYMTLNFSAEEKEMVKCLMILATYSDRKRSMVVRPTVNEVQRVSQSKEGKQSTSADSSRS